MLFPALSTLMLIVSRFVYIQLALFQRPVTRMTITLSLSVSLGKTLILLYTALDLRISFLLTTIDLRTTLRHMTLVLLGPMSLLL